MLTITGVCLADLRYYFSLSDFMKILGALLDCHMQTCGQAYQEAYIVKVIGSLLQTFLAHWAQKSAAFIGSVKEVGCLNFCSGWYPLDCWCGHSNER